MAHGLPGVDHVGADARAAGLGTGPIKTTSKVWAIDTAISMIDLTTLEVPTPSARCVRFVPQRWPQTLVTRQRPRSRRSAFTPTGSRWPWTRSRAATFLLLPRAGAPSSPLRSAPRRGSLQRADKVISQAIDRWVCYAGWSDKLAQVLGGGQPGSRAFLQYLRR